MEVENISVNIRRIAKEKGIPIGTVENTAGVSRGYFSRMTKQGSCQVWPLIRAAKVLGTTLDELVSEPPVVTNADKFLEVFGFHPRDLWEQPNGWLEAPYEEKMEERNEQSE